MRRHFYLLQQLQPGPSSVPSWYLAPAMCCYVFLCLAVWSGWADSSSTAPVLSAPWGHL